MRYLMLFLFFSLPCVAAASIPASLSQGETAIAQHAISHRFTPKKHRFFKYLIEKKLAKRLLKAAGASKRDGRGFAIAGLIAFLLNGVSWALSPLLGLYAVLPLAILGLIFSIIGLWRAKRWDAQGVSRRLAIWGIVLNGAALVFGIAIWIVFANGFAQTG
ncbi:MAG: hypothetical protein ACKVU0_08815 [Saprospiraceae bacterium]